ncbi:MAG: hypothetical protein HKP09_02600 [Enterobacterales bacterium]|nr:hypothetical protein [Enterobacterales bacterium]
MKYMRRLLSFILICQSIAITADGAVVDKVYHPYVLANEREFEWRIASYDRDSRQDLMHRVGYGEAISETVSVEAYLNGFRNSNGDFQLESYEAEVRWMITEQGKEWADWGMLFELEKQRNEDIWESSTAIIMEKEFGRTSLTMNLFAVYEWGADIENEWETEFRLQHRYRWIPEFQPAVEIYMGEDYAGIGPAVIGIKRFDDRHQLKWEAGVIFEVENADQNHTIRFALEYEF